MALAYWVANILPKGANHSNIINKMSSIFVGWSKSNAEKESTGAPTSTLVRRRLRIGAHNGHTIINNQWHSVDLHNDDSTKLDHLKARGSIDIFRYVKHPSCVLLFCCEYEVETVQSSKGLSPKKAPSNTATVVIGMTRRSTGGSGAS